MRSAVISLSVILCAGLISSRSEWVSILREPEVMWAAKDEAQKVQCGNNLNRIGSAMRVWAVDHNRWPTNLAQIQKDLAGPEVLVCPLNKIHGEALLWEEAFEASDYTFNWDVSINDPSQVAAQCRIHNLQLHTDGQVSDTLAWNREWPWVSKPIERTMAKAGTAITLEVQVHAGAALPTQFQWYKRPVTRETKTEFSLNAFRTDTGEYIPAWISVTNVRAGSAVILPGKTNRIFSKTVSLDDTAVYVLRITNSIGAYDHENGLLTVTPSEFWASPEELCVLRLRNLGLAARIAANRDDKFPVTFSGFQTRAGINILSAPSFLICPGDATRSPASDFSNIDSAQTSYNYHPLASTEAPDETLASCKVHGHVLRSGGSVEHFLTLGTTKLIQGRLGQPATLQPNLSRQGNFQFRWKKDGIPVLGETNQTLHISAARLIDRGSYQCSIEENGQAITSFGIQFDLLDAPQAPQILLQSSSQSVKVGDRIGFFVIASGRSGFFVSWEKAENIGGEMQWAHVENSKTAFGIEHATVQDGGTYRPVVIWFDEFDEIHEVRGSSVTVSVDSGTVPYVVIQPSSTNVSLGAELVLSCMAGGAPPLRYEWRKDNMVIQDSTNSTLFISRVTKEDQGTYSVRVINSLGFETSSTAFVGVLDHTPATAAHLSSVTKLQTSYRLEVIGTPHHEGEVHRTTDFVNWERVYSFVFPTAGEVRLDLPQDSGSSYFRILTN